MTTARRTIARKATVKGIGLHTGKKTTTTLRPGEAGQGIVFQRTDLENGDPIRAHVDNVSHVDRRTSLANGSTEVHSVEHLLAAVLAYPLDDLLIEVNGPELPSGDGSAQVFFDAIKQAGIKDIRGTPAPYTVQTPLVVREGDALYTVIPAANLRLTVTVEWNHPAIGRQSGCYDISPTSFETALARARTFGFASEADALRSRGLIQGATEENAIVLSDDGVLTGDLRWPDEFVRHKTVDLLGDLALVGGRLQAEVIAFRPSHHGNVALVRALRRCSGTASPPGVMGIEDILGVIPHRYPMLLVDRILEIEPGKRIVGIKNVTINEPFFQGHFPGHPIMPGVLIVEAMAQVGGMLFMAAFDNPADKVVYFLSIDNVKFRRPVTPGDQLRFELEMLHLRGRNCRMRGIGYVAGNPVAEAEMMARVVDR